MLLLIIYFFLNINFCTPNREDSLLNKIKHSHPMLEDFLPEELKVIGYLYKIKNNQWTKEHMDYVLHYPIYILSFRKIIEERIVMMKEGGEKTLMMNKLLYNYYKYNTMAVTSEFKYMVIMALLRKTNILLLGWNRYKLMEHYLDELIYDTVFLSPTKLKQLNLLYKVDLNRRFIFLLSKNQIKKAEETALLSENRYNIRIIQRINFLMNSKHKPQVFCTIEELHWYLITNYRILTFQELAQLIIQYTWLLEQGDGKYNILKKNIVHLVYKILPFLIINNYEKLEQLLFNNWIKYDDESVHTLCYLRGLYCFYRENYNDSLQYFQQALGKHSTVEERAKYSFWIANSLMALNMVQKGEEIYRNVANLYVPYYSTMSSFIIKKKIPIKSIYHLKIDKKENNKDWYFHMIYLFAKDDNDFITYLNFINSLNIQVLLEVTETTLNVLKSIVQLPNHGYITVLGDKIRSKTGLIISESYIIIEVLKKYHLQFRLLLYSILRKESYGRYTHHLSSYKDAKGIMQVKIETARTLCKRYNIPFSTERLTKDINYNILIGEKCLKELLKIFKGHIFFAIPAYNAGSPQVLKWVKTIFTQNKKSTTLLNFLLFVELIPIMDTKNYTKEVLDNLIIVMAINGVDNLENLEDL